VRQLVTIDTVCDESSETDENLVESSETDDLLVPPVVATPESTGHATEQGPPVPRL
jgi:hypothetical protein